MKLARNSSRSIAARNAAVNKIRSANLPQSTWNAPDHSRPPLISRALLLLLLVSVLGAGCGRYQLGRYSEPPFRSVYVKPISNESFAPQVHALLSAKIAEEIARSGLVRISSEADADVTLEVSIRDYARHVAATRREDTVIAAKLNFEMFALCTLTDNRTGKIYFRNREVSAGSHVYPEQDPLDSALQGEYQSMPILTEYLARDIGRTVMETW